MTEKHPHIEMCDQEMHERDMRAIPGLEGRYYATRDGRIWSERRKRFRAVSKQRDGYLTITLRDAETRKTVTKSVHRLVACAWIPNPTNEPQINHKDGDKANSAVSNLEWCSQSGNMKHAWNTGLQPLTEKMKGNARRAGVISGEARRKLDNEMILEARRRVGEGERQKVIARELGVSQSALSQCLNGRTYKSTFEEMGKAESVGSFLHKRIKGKFGYTKLGE